MAKSSSRAMADKVSYKLLQKHPLQWVESPSRSSSAILHAAGLASFAYSFRYLVVNPNPVNDAYGWHLQYLTIIGLSLATLTFAVGLLADIFLSRGLFRTKNLLGVTSAPMEILISVLYWGLRAIDERLVLPTWAPPITLAADLSFHAAPAALLAADLLFFSPPWTVGFAPAAGLSSALAMGYWAWVEACHARNGFYPYPIFEQLDGPRRAVLFAFSAATFTASTFGLKWMQASMAPRERPGRVRGDAKSR